MLLKKSVWHSAMRQAVREVSAFHQRCLKRKLAAGAFLTRLVR